MEGAHISILNRLIETNYEKTVGYGDDEYCKAAREKIKAEIEKIPKDKVKEICRDHLAKIEEGIRDFRF